MNCIIVDDEEMSRNAMRHLIQQIDYLKIVAVCNGPVEAALVLEKGGIDLMFLDFEMPDMNGLELIKSLSARPLTILTTSHKEHALDAFDHNVVDYLMKPIQLPRLLQSVAKAKDLFDNSKNKIDSVEKDYFFIKTNSVMNKVLIKDILWIEAMGDYAALHTANKRYILHVTLKALEEKVPSSRFVRVHRSYIVAIDNITAVEDTTICINDKLIPIGAIYKDNFMNHLNPL